MILRLEQLAQQRLDHLAIPDELAAILQRAHLGGVQQVAHDDGRSGQAALAQDERRVGSLPRPGRAAQPHDLLREDHVLETALLDQAVPDLAEDQGRVFDFELGVWRCGRAREQRNRPERIWDRTCEGKVKGLCGPGVENVAS